MTVEQYWDKSDDELFALLGAELLGAGLNLSPEDEDSSRRFGTEWFKNKHRALQLAICHHERVQALLGSTGSDRFLDAVAIYDTLRSLDDATVPHSAVLAVLIARVGLGAFCATAPTPP